MLTRVAHGVWVHQSVVPGRAGALLAAPGFQDHGPACLAQAGRPVVAGSATR